jgi:hypothetical protein
MTWELFKATLCQIIKSEDLRVTSEASSIWRDWLERPKLSAGKSHYGELVKKKKTD